MNSNDLGLEAPKTRPVRSHLFENFKSLPELVFTEEELERYKANLMKKSNESKGLQDTRDGLAYDADAMDIDGILKPKLLKFVSLDKFQSKNSNDQILSLTVIDLDKFITESLARIESLLTLECSELGIKQFTWSTIEEEDFEWNPVFVKFHRVVDLISFVRYHDKLPETFGKVVMDENVKTLVDQEAAVNVPEDQQALLSWEEEVRNLPLITTKRDTDVYSDYKVDDRELVDVPKELLDTVKNDIVEFRLRVVKIEKQKREKDALNDKKKSRFKLKKLYHDISNSNAIDEYEDKEEDFIMEEDQEGEDEEVDDLEIEAKRQEQLNELKEREFQAKKLIVVDQDTHRHQLAQSLEVLKQYEQTVERKRVKFLHDFVDNVQSTDNKIDNNLEKFYLNHSNYLKFRSAVLRKEQQRDSTEKDLELFIDQLIEEFIGVQDEALSKFVAQLVDENYPEQAPVLAQLQETLDEDAEVFVKRIYEFLG